MGGTPTGPQTGPSSAAVLLGFGCVSFVTLAIAGGFGPSLSNILLSGLVASALIGPLCRGRFGGLLPLLGGLAPTVLALLPMGPGSGWGAVFAAAAALLLWGWATVALGDAARSVLGARGSGVGVVASLLLAALHPLALLLRGDAGALVDSLDPGRALLSAGTGALDLRDLITLITPLAAARCLVRWRALNQPAVHEDVLGNARVRVFLLPLTLLALQACLWPLPVKLDVSGRGLHSLTPPVRAALGTVQDALLARVFVGGPLDRTQRAELRELRDGLALLERAAAIPYSEEWRDPNREPLSLTYAREAGLAPRDNGAWLAVEWVNLRAHQPVALSGHPEGALSALGQGLGSLRQTADVGPTALVGGVQANLAQRLFGTRVEPLTAESLTSAIELGMRDDGTPTPGVLLLGPDRELDPQMAWLLDRYAMEGGALGLFTLRGGEHLGGLLGPWGVSIGAPLPGGWGELNGWQDTPMPQGAPVPNGTISLDAPEGLQAGGLDTPAGHALLALQGSVPSGMGEVPPPDGAPPPRAISAGSMRVVVGSTGTLDATPELLDHLWGWMLDRADLIELRPPAPPDPPRPAVPLAFAALGVLLSLGLAWFGRER